TKVAKSSDGFDVTGDMTMHGVTKPVTFKAVFNGIGTAMDGKRLAGFELTGSLNRHDFGLSWSKTLDSGSIVLADEVFFDIQVEAKEQV
ncbi:MAG TPA: YceI family protein, partial [Verrucomicrobiae bacterium]|nr:YceI family protein [Verrucomicrobiae bacterium]